MSASNRLSLIIALLDQKWSCYVYKYKFFDRQIVTDRTFTFQDPTTEIRLYKDDSQRFLIKPWYLELLYDWIESCLLIGPIRLHKSLCLPENWSKLA